MPRTKNSPESVMMTDWATGNLSMGGTARGTIFQLMILLLLYDQVLIQDEVFALTSDAASWFSEDTELELLRKCFDIEGLVVLKHPMVAYQDDDLKELATAAPIMARARHIQRYGSRADEIFTPTKQQIVFYHNMDAILLKQPQAQREVGSLQNVDVMQTFQFLLKDVLASRHYLKWRQTAFNGISQRMAGEFIEYIERPEKAAAALARKNIEYKIVPDSDGRPVFNRSLGFLTTLLYAPRQARSMQRLIQTTFAAPFSWRENAAGRYNNFLRELLWMPEGSMPEDAENLKSGQIVSVESSVSVELPLPEIDSDFVAAINTVRNSAAGKNLRALMRKAEQGIDFIKQIEAWNELAFELAKTVVKKKPISIRTTAVRIGDSLFVGSIASGIINTLQRQRTDLQDLLLDGLASGTLGVFSNHLTAVLKSDIKIQKLRKKIERAVEFRCSSIDIPPISTPLVKD